MTPEALLMLLVVISITATLYKGEKIMSELSDLKDSMATLSSDVNAFISAIEAEVASLQAQIVALQNAGQGATAQDLIDLKAQADAIDAAVKAAPTVPAP
jgi:prophage DNA circulation protein